MIRTIASLFSVRPGAVALTGAAVLFAVSATALPTISVSTTEGAGADAYVSGWTGVAAVDTGSSNNSGLWCRKAANTENQVVALRFDLTAYPRAGYSTFSLDIIQYRTNAPKSFALYAVRDGAVGEDNNGTIAGFTDNNWDETQILFSTMPGLHWANTSTADQTPNADAIFLGTIAAADGATNKGRILSFRSPALNDFVLTNADDIVTFLIVGADQNEAGSNNLVRLSSEELTSLDGGAPTNVLGTFAPRLLFDPPSCAVPIILQNPVNQSANAGGTATFTAWFAYDTNTPAFQWQSSTNSGTTWDDISGANASSYTTPAIAIADSGKRYRCIATGCSVSVTNEAAILTVTPPTAIWTGGTGDWNIGGNWNLGIVPGVSTNVFIPSNSVVSYAAPMTAASVGVVTNQGTLTIGAAGFNSGATYMMRPAGGGKLFLASGGAASITGNLATSSNAAISVVSGSSLNVSGELYLGAGSTGGTTTGTAGSTAFLTNSGGTITTAGLRLNPGNGSVGTSSRALIDGGVNNLGNAFAGRESGGNSAPPGLGTSGIVISNGLVNMTSLRIGNNAHGTVLVAGGVTTNTGGVFLANSTATRAARYIQRAGLFVTQGSVTNGGSGSAQASYSVTGGTNLVGGIRFGADGSTGISWFTNSATMYVGAGGISHNGLDTVAALLNPGGLLGASADWTGSYAMTLGAGSFTFRAASLDGTPHNILLSGGLSGTGPLVKTGAGTLTLDAANTYSAETFITEGTLALGGSGSLTSSEIVVASGALFDVSATSYTLPALKKLAGFGSVNGNVNVASTATINPGTNGAPSTLTFSNSLTQTGGAVTHFDLSTNPSGPNNDLVVIHGDLNVSGLNTLDISGGGPAGSVHPLFQYHGSFNGDLSNFELLGASGVLTNITTSSPKVIALRVQTTVRGATNIVWVGNAGQNDWDLLNLTNWLNNASLDFFVTGDAVTFNAVGAANANVNIPVTVQPGAVLVNAATDYTFSGSGAIAGSGTLTKTNSGKLTLVNNNLLTGGVNFNGGTVSVASLAALGDPSPLGASGTLAFNGGTLEYTGANITWSRSLTLNTNGGTVLLPSGSDVTHSGAIGGSGSLTKVGPGTLTLGTGNSHSGGTYLGGGTLVLNNALSAGSGDITFTGNSILSLGAVKPANTVVLSNYSGTVSGGNSGGATGIRNVIGSSNLVVSVTTGVFDLTGDMSTYSGTITLNNAGGSIVRFNGSTGSKLATWDLGSGIMELNLRTSASPCYFGALMGGPSANLVGRSASDNNGPTTYHIGDNGLSTTFEGVIKNGSLANQILSIVKVGTGKLTLSGVNTYTGTTTVSNGVLALSFNGSTDGSIDSSTNINVVAGAVLDVSGRSDGTLQLGGSQALMGGGTVRGSVNVTGTVSPGASVGTLTVTNAVTLSGTALMELNTANPGQTNDVLVGQAGVALGGTLNVTNIGPALVAGQRFVLFSGPISGSFGAVNLPTGELNGTTYTWTDNLAADGSITVATVFSPVSSNPTNITSTVSGTDLTLSWPESHKGWTLQVQTNARSVGLTVATNTWFDVAGSDATNSVIIPLNKVNPTVFYRLRLPQP